MILDFIVQRISAKIPTNISDLLTHFLGHLTIKIIEYFINGNIDNLLYALRIESNIQQAIYEFHDINMNNITLNFPDIEGVIRIIMKRC